MILQALRLSSQSCGPRSQRIRLPEDDELVEKQMMASASDAVLLSGFHAFRI